MKTLAILTVLTLCLSCSLQKDSNSLAASSTEIENFNNPNFQANIDHSQNVVQLKWDNSSTMNIETFTIEKSTNNVTWQEVAMVNGNPEKPQIIEFFHLDYNPLTNRSYYRLKSKNNIGKESVSNSIPVSYFKKEGIRSDISYSENFEKEVLVVIRDVKGNEFHSKVLVNVEDELLVAVPIRTEIPKGDYLITATSENQLYSHNIVIR